MESYLYHHGIIGQRWGLRRYQNEDGTLTDAGQARYDRDVRENRRKKKENRVDTSQPDPNRWVREDLERTKKAVDAAGNTVNQMKTAVKNTSKKTKLDLSNMSDQELRAAINRNLLEQQYTNIYSQQNQSKGREYVQNALEIGGSILAVTGSALSIAIAIKELKG